MAEETVVYKVRYITIDELISEEIINDIILEPTDRERPIYEKVYIEEEDRTELRKIGSRVYKYIEREEEYLGKDIVYTYVFKEVLS